MSLVTPTLFGTINKVGLSIDRLREFEPPEGYWLAFSGGKDSTVIEHLARRSGVRFTAHYNVTTMDPPPLIRFMHRHYPELFWDKPPRRFEELLLEKRFPPLRRMRWCCEHFKESHGVGLIVTGVRRAESRSRQKRKVIEACYKDERRRFFNPIIDWTEAEVWEYIRREELPYCELYDRGWKRIGCVFCPCATRKNRARDAEAFPAMRRRMVRAFDALVELRRASGRLDRKGRAFSWATGEELFQWWIAGERKSKDIPGQRFFFEEGD